MHSKRIRTTITAIEWFPNQEILDRSQIAPIVPISGVRVPIVPILRDLTSDSVLIPPSDLSLSLVQGYDYLCYINTFLYAPFSKIPISRDRRAFMSL